MSKSLWTSMSHNGVAFPVPMSPRNTTLQLDGKEIQLSLKAEEMAYAFARKYGTPYVQDPVFVQNFYNDFVKEVPEFKTIKPEGLMNYFGTIIQQIERDKNAKVNISKDEKKVIAKSRKQQKEILRSEFGFMKLDGRKVPIPNFFVEPSGIFMGRGQHPNRGCWKRAIRPEDVTLNLGEDTPIPPGNWKGIVHDHSSIWVAKWDDPLFGREKYIWPDAGVHKTVRARNRAKFDKAIKIGEKIEKIRSAIEKGMQSKDIVERQTASAAFLIDHLGFRVGNEKGVGETDTVGCTTLRVEHIHLSPSLVEFNFLGKDSVPWQKSLNPPPLLFQNLTEFCKGKKPSELVFDKITSGDVNAFLSKQISDLTAKTFRTYHATQVVKDYLYSKDLSKGTDIDKIVHARMANLEAAKYCNHKRAIPKNFDEQLAKKRKKIEEREAKGKPVDKARVAYDLAVASKEYNLGTSMGSYIDPRVYKEWCESVGLEWAKIYSKSLQNRFKGIV